jgi:CBS domain-containing protein
MKISEVMTSDVAIASPEDTLRTAAKMMADLDVSVLRVAEQDRLIGMVTGRDIAIHGVAAIGDRGEASHNALKGVSERAHAGDKPGIGAGDLKKGGF